MFFISFIVIFIAITTLINIANAFYIAFVAFMLIDIDVAIMIIVVNADWCCYHGIN